MLVFVAMCSVFWLYWLSYQYLPSDWLERLLLRKPNRGEGIVSRKPRPKSAHDFLGLLYCFIVLLCICVVSCPYVIYPTVMARYSLFVLKLPLNPKQTNKHPVMWSETVGLRTRPVWDQKIGLGLAQSGVVSWNTVFTLVIIMTLKDIAPAAFQVLFIVYPFCAWNITTVQINSGVHLLNYIRQVPLFTSGGLVILVLV